MPTGRILIVDDEPALLRLMQTYLTKLGYTTQPCADSATAWSAFTAVPGSFDLVIADFSLAGETGDKLAIRMLEARDGIVALLCSGYPFEVEAVPEHLRPRFATLQKPFAPNMLAEAVQDLLSRRAS